MTRAYYSEWDPFAAAWLRALIDAGHLPAGDVDTRSIVDVQPDDLAGYTQLHFFAGIGGWAYALRLAGWPDDRAVWTGSCPCQPFSCAGKRAAEADARHLWPEFHRLIAASRPAVVFGEQVASALGRDWLAGVRADLEALAYDVGAADLCAAGVGAPHIRQRLWWVANTGRERAWRQGLGEVAAAPGSSSREAWEQRLRSVVDAGGSAAGGMADSVLDGRGQGRSDGGRRDQGVDAYAGAGPEHGRGPERVGDADGERFAGEQVHLQQRRPRSGGVEAARASGLDWRDFRTVQCRDGTARRISAEPGAFPLAHGVPARVGRLRGYGNAINPVAAKEFIEAFCEVELLT